MIKIIDQDKNSISFTLHNFDGAPQYGRVGIYEYNGQGKEIPVKGIINGQNLIYEIDETCGVKLSFYESIYIKTVK